jgi:hypothetical protein
MLSFEIFATKKLTRNCLRFLYKERKTLPISRWVICERKERMSIDVPAAPCQQYKNLCILPGFYFYRSSMFCASLNDQCSTFQLVGTRSVKKLVGGLGRLYFVKRHMLDTPDWNPYYFALRANACLKFDTRCVTDVY